MRKLIVFNQITTDGYFTDRNGDMSWAHKNDPEWNEFVGGNAGGDGTLLFGRVTYQMMASFWPTPTAMQQMPEVAEGMNRLPKLVLSRSLREATWQNTKIVKDLAELAAIKNEKGSDIVVLGSGNVVAQLAEQGLVDEYQLIVNPIALGAGRTLFDGVSKRVALKRTNERAFKNGNVLICYAPA
jgi:dihydrofolate reductase